MKSSITTVKIYTYLEEKSRGYEYVECINFCVSFGTPAELDPSENVDNFWRGSLLSHHLISEQDCTFLVAS